mmetsp:Transcript_2291/g.8886  ORF Transcript_2291/g.8886 Transcript_2291/m.8886 type:complete len:290 (+) Transcript_2291:797-1666(+)
MRGEEASWRVVCEPLMPDTNGASSLLPISVAPDSSAGSRASASSAEPPAPSSIMSSRLNTVEARGSLSPRACAAASSSLDTPTRSLLDRASAAHSSSGRSSRSESSSDVVSSSSSSSSFATSLERLPSPLARLRPLLMERAAVERDAAPVMSMGEDFGAGASAGSPAARGLSLPEVDPARPLRPASAGDDWLFDASATPSREAAPSAVLTLPVADWPMAEPNWRREAPPLAAVPAAPGATSVLPDCASLDRRPVSTRGPGTEPELRDLPGLADARPAPAGLRRGAPPPR